MAPQGPANWRRPYTSIYNDNYRYGNSLYSDTLSDIERKYTDSLSRTQLRSDRPDLAFTTFSGSTLTSSPNPGATSSETAPTSSPRPFSQLTPSASTPKESPFATFESRLNTALHSPYISEDFEPLLSSTERRARSLEAMRPRMQMQEDHPFFSVLPKVSEKPELEKTAEETITKSRKKISEPAPTSASPGGGGGGGNVSQWKEKCRDLQMQLDELTHVMADTGAKVREELYNIKGKFHSDLNDLVLTVEQTSRQCNELQRTVKSQTNQLLEFQAAYDDAQRRLQDSQDEVGTWQKRCQNLRKEMDRLRTELDEVLQRSSGTSRI